MDMVWLRCSLNWSCYNLCSLAVWWLGPHGSQHGALQPSPALAPLPALAPSLQWARRPVAYPPSPCWRKAMRLLKLCEEPGTQGACDYFKAGDRSSVGTPRMPVGWGQRCALQRAGAALCC